MTATLPPGVESLLVGHLLARPGRGYEGVFREYAQLLDRAQDAQTHVLQLEREARELRAENETLVARLEADRGRSVPIHEHEALRKRLRDAEATAATATLARARAADEGMAALRQLAVLRDLHQGQERERTEAEAERARLVESLQAAHEEIAAQKQVALLAADEAKRRGDELGEAQEKLGRADAEVGELARRLVDLKTAEIERLQDIEAMRQDMLTDARRQAAGIVAGARARAGASGGRADASHAARGGPRTPARGSSAGEGASEGADGDPALAPGASPLPRALRKAEKAHDGGALSVCTSRDGQLLATGGADASVVVWSSASLQPVARLRGAFEGVNGVDFAADGRSLLAAESHEAVRVFDVRSGRLRQSLTGHAGRVAAVAASPGDADAAASAGTDRTIKLWSLVKGYCVRTIVSPSACRSLAHSPDGRLIFSGHMDGSLRLWDARTGKAAHEVAGLHQGGCSVAVGRVEGAIVTGGKDGLLRALDPRAFSVLATLQPRPGVAGVAAGLPAGLGSAPWASLDLSPDERHVAAGAADGSILVWDLRDAAASATAGPAVRLGGRGSGGSTSVARASPRAAGASPSPGAALVDTGSPITALAWCALGEPLCAATKSGVVAFWGDSPAAA